MEEWRVKLRQKFLGEKSQGRLQPVITESVGPSGIYAWKKKNVRVEAEKSIPQEIMENDLLEKKTKKVVESSIPKNKHEIL